MSVTETTTESWGSRLGKSLTGVLVGFVLFLISFPLLFWNEGRAVKTDKALNEGEEVCQSVPSNETVDPAYNGQLVHMSGTATTQEQLSDKFFGITYNGIRLQRHVEFYQWVEHEEKHTEKNAGGSTTTTTTYTYSREWVDRPQDSSSFKEAGHTNTVAVPNLKDAGEVATQVSFGAFRLNPGQIDRIGGAEDYSLESYTVPAALAAKGEVQDNVLYIHMRDGVLQQPSAPETTPAETPAVAPVESPAAEPAAVETPVAEAAPAAPEAPAAQPAAVQRVFPADAEIGDIRVTWKAIPASVTISLIAVQNKDTFGAYVAKSSGYRVDLLADGEKSAPEMFRDAHDANTMMTWLIRFGGFLAMFIGMCLIAAPLEVLADVLPFLGNLVGGLSKVACLVLSLILSIITIAIAWVTYRPVLGIALLVLAAVLLVLYVRKRKGKKEAPAEAAAQ